VAKRNKCELDLLTDALYWASVSFDDDCDYAPWWGFMDAYPNGLSRTLFDHVVDVAEEDFRNGVRMPHRKTFRQPRGL
jgi:hypothetical protein